jgi:hypothetical protein
MISEESINILQFHGSVWGAVESFFVICFVPSIIYVVEYTKKDALK